LKSIDGVFAVSVSLLTHKASIQFKPAVVGIRKLIEEVENVGFGA